MMDIGKGSRVWHLEQENAALRAELERERMRLAACGTAALGYFEGCLDEYKSASLDDVLRLRAELAALKTGDVVMVPREPTVAMRESLQKTCALPFSRTKRVWEALLAAAPGVQAGVLAN